MGVGVIHALSSFQANFFLTQWLEFSKGYFINVSPHLLNPLSVISFEKEAAFWFFSCGILLIFFGLALNFIENSLGTIPKSIRIPWLAFSIVSSIMLPASGFPVLVLPHAIWMCVRRG
jgi:hypothetical protein